MKEPTAMFRSILRSIAIPAALLAGIASLAEAGPASPPPDAPFARVYLALRGCTSCSHCRTNIRQMVRAKSEGGEAWLASDQVEVRYPTARTVPLRDVVRSLAENRLHDLSVVDVLFEARGSIAATKEGTTFRMAETGQPFPILIDRAVKRPADGTPVRVTALVDGWRKKGDVSLVAKTIEAVN
jgi:hypothetical protein